ncbi:MAG TPA: YncE family protein [Candidatus Saccharimonadales bacterium]|nr:YncE family protein [Candidatus Saccharimonadales bacterium]
MTHRSNAWVVLLLGLLLSACSAAGPSILASPSLLSTASPTPTLVPTASPSPSPTGPPPGGVYAATVSGLIDPSLAGIPERVYVPDELSGDVVVIDPATFKIVGRFTVGAYPEHITPDWDLSKLYVNNMNSSSLTVIDPTTGRPTGTINVPNPYNLYFSVDGSKAIVVDDFLGTATVQNNGLYFYDRRTWKLLKFLQIPYPGADHLDFSADGSYLMVSCETSGMFVKVDVASMTIAGKVQVGGLPLDVRLSPDGSVFYVANQGIGGVQIVDPVAMKVIGFIPTGRGAHGIGVSRDATKLYVTNRLAGSISVIDLATRKLITTWQVGGTPDMIALSPDGSQLWVSNRYSGGVSVIDAATGKVLITIATGGNPHGLSYWPAPGRYSLGHNGNMR